MVLPILLSFLQICFIPGFILYLFLTRKLKNPTPLLMPVFVFGLSLIINYIIVTCLAYLHIYTRSTLILVFASEIVLLTWIIISNPDSLKAYNIKLLWADFLCEIRLLTDKLKSPNPINFILFISSVLVLLFLIRILILDAGKIFEESDAIFSWNKWATDFYNNNLPSGTYHYPQLIPANWSIAYVFCKYPLQFVPRIIMHLFLIFQVYAFIVLGLTHRSAFYFITAIIIFIGLSARGFFWTDGFVDVSVSFFAILAYLSLVSIKAHESDNTNFVLISILFVCGAAVTKQAGLFVLLSYPLLHYIILKGNYKWSHKNVLLITFSYFLFTCLIVLPYYVWAQIAINNGNAASEIAYVTHDIYKGASYTERLIHALGIFEDIYKGKILFFFFIICYAFSFLNKRLAYINIFFVIPYLLIWSLFFSYDIRNVSLIIPYFSLGVAWGLNFILERLQRLFVFVRSVKIKPGIFQYLVKTGILIFAAIVFFLLNSTLTIERLQKSQDFRLKRLGDEEVNEKIYLYKSNEPFDRKIITDYHYLELLPEIGKYYEYGQIQDLKSDSSLIQDDSTGFLLWSPWYKDSTSFPSFIDANIKSGLYDEIFDHNGFRFIKLR